MYNKHAELLTCFQAQSDLKQIPITIGIQLPRREWVKTPITIIMFRFRKGICKKHKIINKILKKMINWNETHQKSPSALNKRERLSQLFGTLVLWVFVCNVDTENESFFFNIIFISHPQIQLINLLSVVLWLLNFMCLMSRFFLQRSITAARFNKTLIFITLYIIRSYYSIFFPPRLLTESCKHIAHRIIKKILHDFI